MKSNCILLNINKFDKIINRKERVIFFFFIFLKFEQRTESRREKMFSDKTGSSYHWNEKSVVIV